MSYCSLVVRYLVLIAFVFIRDRNHVHGFVDMVMDNIYEAFHDPSRCDEFLRSGLEAARSGQFTFAQLTLRRVSSVCTTTFHREQSTRVLRELQSVWVYVFWRSLRVGDLPLETETILTEEVEDGTIEDARRALGSFRFTRIQTLERVLNASMSPNIIIWAHNIDRFGLQHVRMSTSTATLEYPGDEDFRAALLRFEEAAALDPTNPIYRYHIALCLQRLGETDAARRAYDHLFRLEPYPDVHWLDTYHQLNDAVGTRDERGDHVDYAFWRDKMSCANDSQCSTPLHALDMRRGLSSSPTHLTEETQSRRVVFAGVVRDAESNLREHMIANIERTGSLFRDYAVVIYENDSKDGTVRVLKEWEDLNPRVRVISQRVDRDVAPIDFGIWDEERFRSLARARNMYLRAIRDESSPYAAFDYLIVLDFHATGGWSDSALVDAIANRRQQWDVLCANGRYAWGTYYDGLAFRAHGFEGTLREHLRMMSLVTSKTLDPTLPYFAVSSCFGGMAVYDMPIIASSDCWYAAVSKRGEADCEHVNFHECLRDRSSARLFIAPPLVLDRL